MSDIPALLQPMKDRLTAATPGPWECDGFAGDGVVDLSIFKGSNQGPTLAEGIKRHEDAVFFMNAPTDQAKLIAAIEAVAGLHKPVSAKIVGTPYSLADYDVCPKCFNDDGWPVTYPCPTVAALTQALGGDGA